ncbi:MAG: hypothetical protein KF745_06620 [Phycisphaeraceae bacterium]|nr:hypothetical protein [Phycisphaeraceae bacterium]
MKAFWILIAVLVVAGAFYVVAGPRANPSPAPVPPPAEEAPPAPPTPAPAAPAAPAPLSQPAPEPAPAPVPSQPVEAPMPDLLPDTLSAMVAESFGPAPITPLPEREPASTPDSPAPPSTPPAAEPGAMKVVTRDDGSMLIDDRFEITGKGTRESPYLITWDLLVSAQQTYKPRIGKTDLPPWLDLVKDKYVRINGFVAFPLMAQSPDEMLAMLNQWDGCCIGVPPTPYDAIEVRLRQPPDQEHRLAVYGSVEGKLGIEPYLVKDWLVGLYTMDDAELKLER